MELLVNGQKLRLQEAETLMDVIRELKLEEKLVVTEVNGQVVRRDEWPETPVGHGMKLEIVEVVGGG